MLGHPWLARVRRERQARASQLIRDRQAGLGALRWQPGERDGVLADITRLTERLGDFMPMHGNAVRLHMAFRP